ncbi:hypothetical protein AALP_AA4G074600 [Arabis alpina]|uniref:Uncharacterized protein n=1 Tax=Arabis alpina TaxID=50452 RepID=A0A087H1S6_ARAAL|nr:hypothetical protein AALP_AA4G074600 [Arabis alpina]
MSDVPWSEQPDSAVALSSGLDMGLMTTKLLQSLLEPLDPLDPPDLYVSTTVSIEIATHLHPKKPPDPPFQLSFPVYLKEC